MLKNIIQSDINLKKKHNTRRVENYKQRNDVWSSNYTHKSTSTDIIVMCDKSTSTEDLVKREKERKILKKFQKETKKKQEQAELFKQVLGSPRNIEEIEDE